MNAITSMDFHKSLAKYYHSWFRDSYDSSIYCFEHGNNELGEQYLSTFRVIFDIIINNWDAIEFFSIGDNAFIIDSALPEKFRGY